MVNPHEYGIQPNVWRPAEIPPPFSGSDTGVGAQPRAGTVSTTTTTEFGFPNAAKGWALVGQGGTFAFSSGGGATTLSQVIGPGAYRQEWLVEWYGTFNAGTNATVDCWARFLRRDNTLDGLSQTVSHTLASAPSWFWAAIQFRFPATKAGTVEYISAAGLALAFSGGQPRIIGQTTRLFPAVDPFYGSAQGQQFGAQSREPFDLTATESPSSVPTVHRSVKILCQVEVQAGVSGVSGSVLWTKLWTRGGF